MRLDLVDNGVTTAHIVRVILSLTIAQSMKNLVQDFRKVLLVSVLLFVVVGCASISSRTNAYLGSPKYTPTSPASVQILQAEPKQPKDRLGEVILTVEGQPSREDLERRLKEGAAKLGADAVFIVYDKMHVFPVVYGDWWWGPMGVTEEAQRKIVGVAVKLK